MSILLLSSCSGCRQMDIESSSTRHAVPTTDAQPASYSGRHQALCLMAFPKQVTLAGWAAQQLVPTSFSGRLKGRARRIPAMPMSQYCGQQWSVDLNSEGTAAYLLWWVLLFGQAFPGSCISRKESRTMPVPCFRSRYRSLQARSCRLLPKPVPSLTPIFKNSCFS